MSADDRAPWPTERASRVVLSSALSDSGLRLGWCLQLCMLLQHTPLGFASTKGERKKSVVCVLDLDRYNCRKKKLAHQCRGVRICCGAEFGHFLLGSTDDGGHSRMDSGCQGWWPLVGFVYHTVDNPSRSRRRMYAEIDRTKLKRLATKGRMATNQAVGTPFVEAALPA